MCVIGQKIHHFSQLESTNNYVAKLRTADNVTHGTVILADEQSAGKGQMGTVWHSKPGENILMSIYIEPDNMTVNEQFYLSKYTAVCISNFLSTLGIQAKIKWPNDIYVGKNKIAGILIENGLSANKISHSIIGIGLNVNQKKFNNLNATSIRNERDDFITLNDTFFKLIYQLNKFWSLIATKNWAQLNSLYFEQLLGYQNWINLKDQNGPFEGKIINVLENGQLVISKKTTLEKQIYDLKEIQFIFEK